MLGKGGSSPFYWHQDWTFCGKPVRDDQITHQIFLMWYRPDTNRSNGCLRVIPRSHRVGQDAHKLIGTHKDVVCYQAPETSAGN